MDYYSYVAVRSQQSLDTGKEGTKRRLPTELNFLAVTTHAIWRAIEDAHFGRVFPVNGPVPIRLRAFVAALFSERNFVEPEKVAVPVKENALIAKEFSDSMRKKRENHVDQVR